MKTLGCAWVGVVVVLLSACGTVKASQKSPERGAERRSEVILDNQSESDPFADVDQDVDQDDLDIERISPDFEEEEEDELCYKGDPFICEIEAAIVRQTNDLRAPAKPFKHSPNISYIARMWSDSMGGVGFISHFGFPRSRESNYRDEFGNSASLMAENVAMNYSNSQSAEDVARSFTQMWWGSSGHRRNMQGNYEMLGVGVYKSGSRYYATQIFGRE